MSVIVLQNFVAKEGQYDALAQLIASMLVDTAARRGAKFVHAAGDKAGGSVTVYQQWESLEDLQGYTAWRAQTDTSALIELLGAVPRIEQLAQLF